jgi:hypothetical protein
VISKSVLTAWHIFGLQVRELPDMEGSYKYKEQAVVDSQQGVVL